MTAPLRLILDRDALVGNWRALQRLSGRAACGAAVKADGYGLGATGVVKALANAGCRDFFVATWAEAEALAPLGVHVSVLHGVRAEDMAIAAALPDARPVLNTPAQVARWREGGGGPCDVMVDTGMNRLGLSPDALESVAGLEIDTVLSHLASADEDVPSNARQAAALAALRGRVPARRFSLANSAGIALGADYAFDLTRPGLALYGGVPRASLSPHIRQVAFPEAQILQRRVLKAGQAIGYNATHIAARDTEVAIVNLGYADGYWRGFSGRGVARAGGVALPVLGRVSMDLTALDVSAAPALAEGDWVRFDFQLGEAAALSGMSPYELLVGLGARFDRVWA
ncbi:alanine racemase [Sphingomonas sp.]|uniref:alanine racemase n=1 Tax=Sphingomonas sp. TaxID=28214 RepID=UPI001D85F845|nr:alanine racemase [Sphingomonas sp.]MBX9795973.1 alanine racemase [Sphingomonas sp.]